MYPEQPSPYVSVAAPSRSVQGGEGGEDGEGGGEGDRKVKQTLKPLSWVLPSDDQLSAEASTPSGPIVPE